MPYKVAVEQFLESDGKRLMGYENVGQQWIRLQYVAAALDELEREGWRVVQVYSSGVTEPFDGPNKTISDNMFLLHRD